MMLPFLSRQFGIDRDHRSKLRRLEAGFEGLESRIALSGGSVVQTGALVTVTPASSGPSLVVVSHGLHNGVSMLDVNLNGTDNFFALNQVGFVYDRGNGCSSTQTFEQHNIAPHGFLGWVWDQRFHQRGHRSRRVLRGKRLERVQYWTGIRRFLRGQRLERVQREPRWLRDLRRSWQFQHR